MGCGGSTPVSDTNNNEGKQQQKPVPKQQQEAKPEQNGIKHTGGHKGTSQSKTGNKQNQSNTQSQYGNLNQQLQRDSGPELSQEPQQEEIEVAITEPGYPSPKPPKDSRDDIFQAHKMRKIDQHARNTPSDKADDFITLITHLTSPCHSDVEKLRAIYTWLGNQSMDSGDSSDINKPKGFMSLIKQGRASYASFFAVLCRHANIPCVIVEGHAKSSAYNVGDDEEKIRTLTNKWNAVYVADGWRLVFPLWACMALPEQLTRSLTRSETRASSIRLRPDESGNKQGKVLNEYFFLTNPEEFVHVALPKAQRWQLVARPWSIQKFLEVPHCRQFYFREKVSIDGKFASTLRAKDGMCSIKLLCDQPNGMAFDIELTYNREESGHDIASPEHLNNYVLITRTETNWEIIIRFPEVGIYTLLLYGGRGYQTQICAFKIIAQEVQEEVQPYPLNPGSVGFGPSSDTERAGCRASSHKTGVVKVIARNDVFMNFTLLKDLIVRTELFSNKMSKEELNRCINQTLSDRSLVLQVQVPVHGEYALTMHAQPKDGSGANQNVCNYLLTTDDGRRKRLRAWENPTEKHTRLMVQSLTQTRSTRDIERLEKELTRFDQMALEDKGDYTAGHDALEYKKVKKELEDAVKRRHLETLEKAVDRGQKSRFRDKVRKELEEAEQVRDHLKHLNTISHDVLEMKQPTISELRSYKIPPAIVEDIMRSTFLILGEKEVWLQDWEDLQVLMGKTGKDGMLRRVRQFDTVNVRPEARKHAEKTLNEHTELEARIASAGAGTFFVWLHDVMKVLDSGGDGENGDTEQTDLITN
ncbi:hypothetical protein ACF0H5_012903 [Mactra antiquata]